MKTEFDPIKDMNNINKHGISLAEVAGFEWVTCITWQDMRKQYNEERFNSVGYIGTRLYYVTYVFRNDVLRVISLRKANKREETRYAST